MLGASNQTMIPLLSGVYSGRWESRSQHSPASRRSRCKGRWIPSEGIIRVRSLRFRKGEEFFFYHNTAEVFTKFKDLGPYISEKSVRPPSPNQHNLIGVDFIYVQLHRRAAAYGMSAGFASKEAKVVGTESFDDITNPIEHHGAGDVVGGFVGSDRVDRAG